MKLLVAVLTLFWGCPSAAEVWQADARSSAKFVRPEKVREARHPRNCASRAKLVEMLSGKHNEAVAWEGVSTQGLASELWLGSGTWTWTFTDQSGRACVVASGRENQTGS